MYLIKKARRFWASGATREILEQFLPLCCMHDTVRARLIKNDALVPASIWPRGSATYRSSCQQKVPPRTMTRHFSGLAS